MLQETTPANRLAQRSEPNFSNTTRYELPQGGITLLGYVVRRMHKTSWLALVPDLIADGSIAKALEIVALYAAASATSFGKAYYQPRFDRVGDTISETDPATDAQVVARLDSVSPHYHLSYEATMPDGSSFQGKEEITGTTFGLRGLGMPAPSRFTYTSGDYRVELSGLITSELALSLFSGSRIRAYGSLRFKDNLGNSGSLELSRDSRLTIKVNDRSVKYWLNNLPDPHKD